MPYAKVTRSQEHFRLADWQWRSGHSAAKSGLNQKVKVSAANNNGVKTNPNPRFISTAPRNHHFSMGHFGISWDLAFCGLCLLKSRKKSGRSSKRNRSENWVFTGTTHHHFGARSMIVEKNDDSVIYFGTIYDHTIISFHACFTW